MAFKTKPSIRFKKIDDLSREEAKEEIEALREGIAHHDHLYHVENRPEISDATYDRLFRRLEELSSTTCRRGSGSAPVSAARAGHWPGSSRRARRRRGCTTSPYRSA